MYKKLRMKVLKVTCLRLVLGDDVFNNGCTEGGFRICDDFELGIELGCDI